MATNSQFMANTSNTVSNLNKSNMYKTAEAKNVYFVDNAQWKMW